MPETFSTYNLEVKNNLAFTSGPTAGYILSINTDGSTYWGHTISIGAAGTQGATGAATASNILTGSVSFSATQSLNSAATYITGSALRDLGLGSSYRWRMCVAKTAAGTAGPIIDIRYGTSGSITDTSFIGGSASFLAQTAAADTGIIEIDLSFASVTPATCPYGIIMTHNLSTTGLANTSTPQIKVLQGGAATVSNGYFGICINPGASAIWTVKTLTAIASHK